VKRRAAEGLFLCITGLWAAAALAAQAPQEGIFRHPLGPNTENAFKAACSSLAKHPFIIGNFDQEKTLSRLNRSLKSSGNFIITANSGMVWETLKPFPSTLVLGRDYLIQSRPGGQKTVLSAQGNETFLSMAEVLNAVFSGNAQGLVENFDIYFSGGSADNSGGWELGLLPQEKAIASFAARIIMKGDSAIKSIVLYEQNGDCITYTLSNHSYPAELNAREKAHFTVP